MDQRVSQVLVELLRLRGPISHCETIKHYIYSPYMLQTLSVILKFCFLLVCREGSSSAPIVDAEDVLVKCCFGHLVCLPLAASISHIPKAALSYFSPWNWKQVDCSSQAPLGSFGIWIFFIIIIIEDRTRKHRKQSYFVSWELRNNCQWISSLIPASHAHHVFCFKKTKIAIFV